jgi:hypothetical protein
MDAGSLFNGAGQDIQEQVKITSADSFTGRNNFPYKIVATQIKGKVKFQLTFIVCAICVYIYKKQTGKDAKLATAFCQKCGVGLCIGQCFENY